MKKDRLFRRRREGISVEAEKLLGGGAKEPLLFLGREIGPRLDQLAGMGRA